MIKLLVGLGNPGAEYEDTRHNAGFWFVDRAARELKLSLVPERPWFGLAARATGPAGPVWLLEPMTYMNLSGKAVGALARFYKITPPEVLVVHDELDLPPGEKRLKFGGSHAGHNGLKDVHAALGSADYWRLRIGIGHPGVRAEVVNWVLRKPPAAERDAIDAAIDQSLVCLPLLLAGEMERATMKINARPKPPKPPKPAAPPPADGGPRAP
jgi:PTH1 family peptidyl-tRNA hydrolase